MRACVQRVKRASVTVEDLVVGRIGRGLLVLLGVATDDSPQDAHCLGDNIIDFRLFEADA